MKANANIAEVIRHIQKIANTKEFTAEQIEEYEFYLALSSVLSQAILPGFVGNLVNFPLKHCSIEKAVALAEPLGLHIIKGSTSLFISWSKGLDD